MGNVCIIQKLFFFISLRYMYVHLRGVFMLLNRGKGVDIFNFQIKLESSKNDNRILTL